MSRMERMEEQHNMRRVWTLAGITFGVVVLAVFVGVPLMIRLAVWWGDVNAKKTANEKTDFIPPVPPRIIIPFEATNSATIKVAGTAEADSTVALGNNGEPVGSVTTSKDGVWSVDKVTLSDGVNSFFAYATDQSGNKSGESDQVNVVYAAKAPELVVESPADRQLVTGKEANVELKGKTRAGVRLTVNDRVIIVGGDGKFNSKYKLTSGENLLAFLATDQFGNQTRKEIVVEYRE